jgi:hypothetical protein
VCEGRKLIAAPAKKITNASGQPKIDQSQHTQFLADLWPALAFGVAGAGANRKRSIFFVKHLRVVALM